jgi:hypothetical protein
MAINHISFHLDVAAYNAAGLVFSNPLKKVTVIRWESLADEVLALELAEAALVEMENQETGTLIYDLRKLPEEELQPFDVQLRIYCLESGLVERWGWLSTQATPLLEPAEVQKALGDLEIVGEASQVFCTLAQLLDSHLPPEARLLTQPSPPNFSATYSGSTYSLPDVNATVIRTAGNPGDLDSAKWLFEQALEASRRMGANALILDTSASPPLIDELRYEFAYKSLLLPVGAAKLFKHVVHVRAGDGIVTKKGLAIEPLISALEANYYEVPLMEEAISLLSSLQSPLEGEAPSAQ